MPAKAVSTPALPGLSPVCGKPIIARFDGGKLSSDGGVLALREIETRLGIANRLAACVTDPRAPERVIHSMADILRFRMLMIAAGYEDANDAASLRHDPAFKLALRRAVAMPCPIGIRRPMADMVAARHLAARHDGDNGIAVVDQASAVIRHE